MTGTTTTDTDYTTREGAQALADKLNAFWHAQGHTMVTHWIEPVPVRLRKRQTQTINLERAIIWTVKSNLVRGQPPRSERPT